MKKLEIIFALTLIISAILKILQVPWGGAMLAISLLILSAFYYFLGFILFKKKILKESNIKPVYKIIFAIAVGWSFSVVFLGALFKLEHLPYAGYLLIIGGIASLLLLLLSLLFTLKTNPSSFYQILIRSVLIVGGGVILYLTI